jgi:hypothetical protein
MRISKHRTFLVLANYEQDGGELRLRQEIVRRSLDPNDPLNGNVVCLTVQNEEDLAQRIARSRELLPVETLVIFAETRHSVSLRPIFKRKFGKALEIRTFRATFESNHPWLSTSSSFAWICWNLMLRFGFESRKRVGRTLRRRLRSLFRA